MLNLDSYLAAEREVDKKRMRRTWLVHAAFYVLAIIVILAVNVLVIDDAGEEYRWFLLPMLVWAIVLAGHYVAAVPNADRAIDAHQAKVEGVAQGRLKA
jgi:hypothetical protein